MKSIFCILKPDGKGGWIGVSKAGEIRGTDKMAVLKHLIEITYN